AEATAVVNNCAAAVLLMLTALAKGKEVIVARGELVEIGGGFRMPEVMRLSGARMVEVGTTNRTRAEDYAAAVTPKTVAIMKVHASNFQVVGFTESVELKPLAAIARQHQLLLLHDLGSGALLDTTAFGLAAEPRIQDSLLAGVDLVASSADKLLGGPQAGLLFGRADLVERVMKHPLARAVRVDKLTIAALAATLDLYLTQSFGDVPIWTMLSTSLESVRSRAQAWQSRLAELGVAVELAPAESTIGGGSLPGERLPTTVVVITPRQDGATDLLRRLREHEPPVMGRIVEERVLLDPRTVLPDEDDVVVADEGPMPQTREHLAIIDLLAIQHGLVVLTKADLVDAAWLRLMREEVAGLIQGTAMQRAPIVAVSGTSGEGLDELRAALDAE